MASETKTVRSRRTRDALVASVHDRLTASGRFTAVEIAADVGCTAGTFWAHFDDKDDAIAAAFGVALDALVDVTESVFGTEPGVLAALSRAELGAWATGAIDRMVTYFSTRSLLYRAALARLPEHRPIRESFRRAEADTIEIARRALGAERAADDAAALISFCQGLNNPIVLRSRSGDRMRRQLGRALVALTLAPEPTS